MSIERRTFRSWFCVCDRCDAEISGGLSFQDAVAAMKKQGWENKKAATGAWYQLCPACRQTEQTKGADE